MDLTHAYTSALDALKELVLRASTQLTLGRVLSLAGKVGKVAIFVLFLVNIRSWPLVWHIRVFRSGVLLRLEHKWIMLCASLKSPAQRLIVEDKWLDSISPIGRHPLDMMVPFTSWASIDDSDFNGHLSNSSYGKTGDSARFKAAVQMFPRFFPLGGWMALAATHYHFIREIPMFASYEVRTTVAAWDQKWIYVMSKYVRKPNGKKKQRLEKKPAGTPSDSDSPVQLVPLRTAKVSDMSSTNTPLSSGIPTPAPNSTSPSSTDTALKAVAAGLAGTEPDGATLHTVVVSQLCFKIGRITIPPALVLAMNGFTKECGYSHTNPHPEWVNVRKLLAKPLGGGKRKARDFLQSGWREVAEAERWWEGENGVLGGEIEERRRRNLEVVGQLKMGLEGVREL